MEDTVYHLLIAMTGAQVSGGLFIWENLCLNYKVNKGSE